MRPIQKPPAFILASRPPGAHHYRNMTYEQMQCPKCKGEMVQGFVPDFTHQHALVQAWHEGKPKKSFWRRTKAHPTEGLPVGAFRCERCGYLEFYADPKFAAQ